MQFGRRARSPSLRQTQHGVATLVIVMVLFFIVALVAAYTSRNLIFEQRTSSNQYRSTQAFEAAEAGLEWALTMLNSGRIDAACEPHTDPATTDSSFRQRYLEVDADGRLDGRMLDGQPLRPACVFDGSNWRCSCPLDAAPSLVEPTGTGPFPAFVLRFSRNDPTYPAGSGPYPPGIIRIESTGCTRVDAAAGCAPAAASGDGRATVTILAALKSGLAVPPTSAVIVPGDLTGAEWLRATNADPALGGFTLRVGGEISGMPTLIGPPGTPSNITVVRPDFTISGLSADGMFAAVFGMARSTYRLQPATVRVDCAVDCSAVTVRDMALLNPGRVLWVQGDFELDIADPIGSATFPVALVIDGNATISHAGALLNGVVYSIGDTLTNIGGLTLTGALVAQGGLTLAGTGMNTVVYDAAMLNVLNRTNGSFVRVPGSWRDF